VRGLGRNSLCLLDAKPLGCIKKKNFTLMKKIVFLMIIAIGKFENE